MTEEEVIHVGLYGGKGLFGGREKPLEASVVSCDKHHKCSYFKNGYCFNVRSPLTTGCKFGSVNNIRGYTSRAKKYYQFKDKWKEHEKYGRLQHPPEKLGVIGSEIVFPYPHIKIEKTNDGEYQLKNPSMGRNKAYIDYDRFTPELIYKICTFRPQAMMGGEIRDYQKKTVPLFLSHLEEIIPDKYNEFINTYEEFADSIDYLGRTALLKTIKPSFVEYKSRDYPNLDEKWYWNGEVLTYDSGYVSSFSVTKDYDIIEIKIKPSDKSKIKITNNDQVASDTVFVD